MRVGVSDLFLPYPIQSKKGYWPGLWIEMKRKKKSGTIISQEQRQWLMKMHKVGYAISVSYGFEDAKVCLESYLKGDPLPVPPFIQQMAKISSNASKAPIAYFDDDCDNRLCNRDDTEHAVADLVSNRRQYFD